MRFAEPHFLWLLLVFPPGLLLFFWWSWRQRQQLMQQFIQARLLPNLTIGLSPARQKFRLACLIAGVFCLILTLARPQWGYDWEEVKQRGLDIVVAIDTSKSMLARDIAPNRLARAKLATLDLMRLAKTDRLGLVAFAGSAFLQCPLTIDETSFRQSLDALDVNIIPQGGTALAEAIDTALTAFKEENNYKVLVILTDGEDHDSGALEAAERAAKAGMRIFTIGIGTAEGELLQVQNDKGQTDFVRDDQGNVVKSRLNETLLQQIAGATEGGFYLPLRGAKPIELLYERGLAPLPKLEGQEKLVRRYRERFHWPLALAIVLLAFEMVWPETKRTRAKANQPRPHSQERRPAAPSPSEVTRPATLAVLLASVLITNASPSSALRDYEAGRYDESLKGFQESIKRKGDDPRLRFNAGAAAYRDGKFDEAAKLFGQAATAQDLQLQRQALYNLGNALYRAGEAGADPKQTQANWEKALQQYQSALKLNAQDTDAKFNQEFVKQRLEELKQQQQQQSQQDQKQDQKDQKDQKDQQQQQNDQSKQDQQQQTQQNQQQEQRPQAQDQKQQDQQKQKSQQPKDQQEQQQAQQSPGQPKDGEQPEEQKGEERQAIPGQMTTEEAKRLLDAQKGEEQVLQFPPEGKPRDARRPFKDW